MTHEVSQLYTCDSTSIAFRQHYVLNGSVLHANHQSRHCIFWGIYDWLWTAVVGGPMFCSGFLSNHHNVLFPAIGKQRRCIIASAAVMCGGLRQMAEH
jgi:hypothetical protein